MPDWRGNASTDADSDTPAFTQSRSSGHIRPIFGGYYGDPDCPRQGRWVLHRQFLGIHALKRSEQIPQRPTPPQPKLDDLALLAGRLLRAPGRHGAARVRLVKGTLSELGRYKQLLCGWWHRPERTALTGAVDGVTHLDSTAALSTLGEAITRALHDTALTQH